MIDHRAENIHQVGIICQYCTVEGSGRQGLSVTLQVHIQHTYMHAYLLCWVAAPSINMAVRGTREDVEKASTKSAERTRMTPNSLFWWLHENISCAPNKKIFKSLIVNFLAHIHHFPLGPDKETVILNG